MSAGLVGRKIGMSRVFTPEGSSIPVTVVEILPNWITQVRTKKIDGYDGIQVTTGERRPNRVSKPMKGHFAKAEVEPGRGVWEFRLDQEPEVSPGYVLTVDLLKEGMKVDVSGRSIGKGFSGVMKRYGFGGGRASHGNSKAHRLAGSIGNAQDPGRVFKGKKMAGHQGDQNVVQQNLDIVKVDFDRNIILISGSIPGSKGTDVIVRPAVKSKEKTDLLANVTEPSDAMSSDYAQNEYEPSESVEAMSTEITDYEEQTINEKADTQNIPEQIDATEASDIVEVTKIEEESTAGKSNSVESIESSEIETSSSDEDSDSESVETLKSSATSAEELKNSKKPEGKKNVN